MTTTTTTTTTTDTTPAPAHVETVRYRSAGMRDVRTDLIEEEAKAAALANVSLVDACPYPFGSEAGLHFAAVWYLHRDPTEATVASRPAASPAQPPARPQLGMPPASVFVY